MRFLILEDNQNDVELVLDALRPFGRSAYRVARNAREYLEALEQPWDVILADHNLPGFDALSALNILVYRNLTNIPLIVVTGSLGLEARKTLLELGAKGFVLKSDLDSLVEAVNRVVKEAN